MKATLRSKIKSPLNLPLFDTLLYMFNIDWNKWIRWLLPSYLKKERHLAWLKVMLSGLIALHQDLLAFRTSARARAAVTNQTAVLEDELNVLMGLERGQIVIRNQVYQSLGNYKYFLSENSSIKKYRYFLSENAPPTYAYTLAEQQSNEANFIIYVPVGLDISKVSAFIDKYKLPDKTYQIVIK